MFFVLSSFCVFVMNVLISMLALSDIYQKETQTHKNQAGTSQLQVRHFNYLSNPDLHLVRKCKIGDSFNNHDHAQNAQEKFHLAPFFDTGLSCLVGSIER